MRRPPGPAAAAGGLFPAPLAGLVAGLLTACAVGPDYQAPAIAPPAAAAFVSHADGVDPAKDPPDAWWRLYEDERLAGFVAEALAANTDLRVAMANLQLARAVMREAHAGRYPTTQLSAGALYGRSLTADSIAAAFRGHAEDQTTYLGSIDVAYEVDLAGRVSRSIEASQADAQAAEATRDAVRVAVAAETTRAYVAACSAGHELEVARRSVEIAEQTVSIVARQRSAGAASDFDLARVNATAEQARAQLPVFEGRRRAAVFELSALLGRPPAEAPAELAGDSHLPTIAAALPVGDGAQLLARRPDVRQAERRLAAATARVGVATAALYPRVSFGANFGMTTNDALKGSNALTLAIGPLVSWSFPNQAVARARIAQSDAAASAALAGFDGTVLRALKEVEQAINAYDAETTRRVSLQAAEGHAAEAYRLSQSRRREGALSQLDLLVAEQSLLGARAALAASDSRIADAQISLFKALGGGWREAPAEKG